MDLAERIAGVPVVRARHAASLILVRRDSTGPSVLMGMRGAKHRFMPNRLVFPGGAVDPADLKAPAASELRDTTRRLLERRTRPALARGLATAAARELEEETGLTLGTPPALDGLDFVCRACTPPGQPMRFNARFLAVDAERVTGTLAGSGELEGLRWFGVGEALELDLAWVTHGVLTHLRDYLAMSPAERDARTRTPVALKKSWKTE